MKKHVPTYRIQKHNNQIFLLLLFLFSPVCAMEYQRLQTKLINQSKSATYKVSFCLGPDELINCILKPDDYHVVGLPLTHEQLSVSVFDTKSKNSSYKIITLSEKQKKIGSIIIGFALKDGSPTITIIAQKICEITN